MIKILLFILFMLVIVFLSTSVEVEISEEDFYNNKLIKKLQEKYDVTLKDSVITLKPKRKVVELRGENENRYQRRHDGKLPTNEQLHQRVQWKIPNFGQNKSISKR